VLFANSDQSLLRHILHITLPALLELYPFPDLYVRNICFLILVSHIPVNVAITTRHVNVTRILLTLLQEIFAGRVGLDQFVHELRLEVRILGVTDSDDTGAACREWI